MRWLRTDYDVREKREEKRELTGELSVPSLFLSDIADFPVGLATIDEAPFTRGEVVGVGLPRGVGHVPEELAIILL